ncbi:MAG: GGDEF domain-containing protein, partial [Lachnospiraceae bacterium]|nr:GGDEF domain-containing protein [Lachnospiraceae bacterium]
FSLAGSIIKQPHDEYLAICLIDLDGFKQINDKLGHQMGDKAIQITGNTIIDSMHIEFREKWSFTERAIAEKLSFAGRLGGDEFIVLVRGKNGREDVEAFLTNVLQCLNEVKLGDLHGIKASFGVTEILPGDNDIDTAYSQADAALYESKRAGKNQINFFQKTGGGVS